ncbi:MAG: hypothetical protein VW518_00720 [Burkholderiaceae bacterium]
MTRAADFSGNADSKQCIISFWYRCPSQVTRGTHDTIFQDALGYYGVDVENNPGYGAFWAAASDSVGTTALATATGTGYGRPLSWIHVLFACDLATSTTQFYINDVEDKDDIYDTTADLAIDWTRTNHQVGITGINQLDSALAEVYIAPGQYLDLSVTANRRKFITASKKPAWLGTTGALPTGTAPLVYLHLDPGEPLTSFTTNRGSGGDYDSITGTLAPVITRPSDPAVLHGVAFTGAHPDRSTLYSIAGAFSGIANSKSGIFSCWLRLDEEWAATDYIFRTSAGLFQVDVQAGPDIRILGFNSTPTQILNIQTATAVPATNETWIHVLASWDLATTTTHLYISDVSNKTENTVTDDTIAYTNSNGSDMALPPCGLADVYWAPGQYLDFSVEANRRKFISASGHPVPLGPTGALPTGSVPILYNHLEGGQPESAFRVNLAGAGNWSSVFTDGPHVIYALEEEILRASPRRTPFAGRPTVTGTQPTVVVA